MEHYGMDEETAVAAVAKYRERYHPTGIFECSLFDGVEDALKSLDVYKRQSKDSLSYTDRKRTSASDFL